jgi:glucose-1-phosphate cytidylyltransferase
VRRHPGKRSEAGAAKQCRASAHRRMAINGKVGGIDPPSMKAVILAGGLGTRISEETSTRPKPMIEVGGKPVLWHILKIYSHFGIHDFIICCGYKGYVIKEYFANYFLHTSDVTFDMSTNSMEVHSRKAEPWRVTLVDTGENTLTGGRLRRVREHIGEETFCFTYGDGVADVDVTALIAHHKTHGRLGTVTAVQPPGRYGALQFGENAAVSGFQEKPQGDGGWINGGFFVLEPEVIDRIEGDATTWEQEPLRSLAADGQLTAYHHKGFWQPMDTLRDRVHLEELWAEAKAPWKVW